jgi:tetratricopeptide (TPR) repeat protein
MTIAKPSRLALVLALVACERQPTTESPDLQPEPEPVVACEGADRLARQWTPEREQELDAALAELPGEWPRRLVDTLDARVEQAGPAWAASYRTACAEQNVARQRCLERRADELEGLVTLIVRKPDLAARLAPWAEIQLSNLEVCETSPSPHGGPLTPEMGAELAATALLFSLTEYPSAVEGVNKLAEMHAIVDDPIYRFTLEAMASVLEFVYGNAESATARFTALGHQLQDVGARERSSYEFLTAMVASVGDDRPGAVAALQRSVTAERELGDPMRIAYALENLGQAQHLAVTDTPGAIASLTEAIGLYTRFLGSESAHAAAAQVTLAELQAAAGRVDVAQDLLLQARDGLSAALGSDHPATNDVVLRLGRLLLDAGRPTDAYHAFLDLLEIAQTQYGDRDVRVADAKLELAEALRAMGEHDGARITYLEALPILFESRGAEHRSIAQTSVHLGQSLVELGKAAHDHELLDQAETHCSRGQSLVAALPENDPLRAEAAQCIKDLAAARKKAGKRKTPKPAKPAN